MLERFYSAPKTLARLRTGPSGQYIDDFAEHLAEAGYCASSAVRYLRAAAHLGQFLLSEGKTFSDIDAGIADAFRRHLPRCRCPLSNGGKVNHHTFFGVKCFYRYLVDIGVCSKDPICPVKPADAELVIAFRHWLENHRGAAPSTCNGYCRYAGELIRALGDEPAHWTVKQLRAFFLDRCHRGEAHALDKHVTAVRSFLRYLIANGHCRSDLDQAVPTLAHWRLATLPPTLSTQQIQQLYAACEGDSPRRVRDRAIIVLLLRLGLRASDVARMRLTHLDWDRATLCVSGKGRYDVTLPLPQDVGDAVLEYLNCRPRCIHSEHVFVTNIAPYRAHLSSSAIGSVVKRALRRAGINTPVKGAHLLRHTAATQMLREGVALEQIGAVLRHRRLDTTAYYAKVDEALLQRVVQPWPEVSR